MVKIKTADLLTIKLDEQILPPLVRDIAKVIGLAETLKLVDHFGGTTMRVPVRFKPDHVLCKIIGPASTVELIKVFEGEALEIAKCDDAMRMVRNRLIVESDKIQKELAREWGLTERQIRNIKSKDDLGFDERQDRLF
jgi:mannose/fructose-specific phosphotransferase system component IIA